MLQKRQDRHTYIVNRVSGSITLEKRKSSDSIVPKMCYLYIGGEKLDLTYYQYRMLKPYQHTNWSVYYFTHSKTIASLEPY